MPDRHRFYPDKAFHPDRKVGRDAINKKLAQNVGSAYAPYVSELSTRQINDAAKAAYNVMGDPSCEHCQDSAGQRFYDFAEGELMAKHPQPGDYAEGEERTNPFRED